MSTINALGMFLWYLGIALLVAAAVLLKVRRLYSEFPVFGSYIVYHVFDALIALWIWKQFGVHYYSEFYKYSEYVDAVFAAALVLEIYAQTLTPNPAIRRTVFICCALVGVVLLMGGIWMVVTTPDSEIARLATRLIVLIRSAEFVRLGLLFLLFVLCRLFGITWRHYLFGIAVGLAISTGIDAVNGSLRIQFGWKIVKIYVAVAALCYDLGVAVRVYYLLASESEVRVTQVPPSKYLTRWNSALEELLAG